jgi:hypothetical protein
LAHDKHTTVGALLGTEKRKFTVNLPPALAAMCGQSTLEIVEEREGISAPEIAFWNSFYEIEAEREKKKR